jgi:phosphodiesterase/alkaline phosphatase D-like protein
MNRQLLRTVQYGRTMTYQKSESNPTSLVVQHSVTLTKLSAHTRYHYRVESKDAAGNVATSEDLTFKTSW